MHASESITEWRYFISYSGVKLPLKLVNEIPVSSLTNRNTFYRGHFDAAERLLLCQKMVYGEMESEHRYVYDDKGVLKQALITEEDEVREILF